MQLTGPETLLRFDKRMAAATDGLREGLNWGELVNAGGSPASILALHTSHPSEQVRLGVMAASCLYIFMFLLLQSSCNLLFQVACSTTCSVACCFPYKISLGVFLVFWPLPAIVRCFGTA